MAQRFINPAVNGTPTFKVFTNADGYIAKTGQTANGEKNIKLGKFAVGDTQSQYGTTEEWELVNAFGETIFDILCGGGQFDEYDTEMTATRGVVEI